MTFLRKFWLPLALLLILLYGITLVIHSNDESNKKEEARQQYQMEVERNELSAIKRVNANYMWMKKFQHSLSSGKLFSSDLELEWINKGPIFFPGYIKDISSMDEENYRLNFKYLKLDYIIPGISLNLICKKSIVDPFLHQNPDARSGRVEDSGVALLASISSISIDSGGHPVGNGSCIELLRDVGLGDYKLIKFN